MLLRHWLIFIVAALLHAPVTAQVSDAVEQWMEENGDEGAASELSDMLQQLAADPVDINDSLAVSHMPLLTPFQKKALHNYILLYGPLQTLKELPLIPGFDSATVALITPLVRIGGSGSEDAWWKVQGYHTLVSGIGGTVEQARGYRDGTFEGDNMRALFCYTYRQTAHLMFRFCADKDPAEAWGKGNHYNYHLVLNDIGPLETFVAGRYNLQFGQGLTLWTGFAPFRVTGQPAVRFGQGARPASPFSEEGYQEGVAATVKLPHRMNFTAFGSRRVGEWLTGGHWGYRSENLMVGFTAAFLLLDDSLHVRDYVYNQLSFRGDRQFHLGVDAAWQKGSWLLYGEAAVGDNGAPAAVGGLQLLIDNRNKLGLGYRYYHPEYNNLYAQPYSVGGSRNERGLSLDATLRLPFQIDAMLSADLHASPALRYACYAPSSGGWLRANLERPLGRRTRLTVGYAFRRKQRNVPNIDSTLYLAEQTERHQWQCRVRMEKGPWRLTARGILTRFTSEAGIPQTGGLVATEVRYQRAPWRVAIQAAWFNVDGYYARIYLTESTIQYAFSIPMLDGRGLRLSMLAQYAIDRRLTLSARYTLTAYPGEETIGSGSGQLDANHRQTYHFQLSWKF